VCVYVCVRACECVLIVCDLETSTVRRSKNELRFFISQEKRNLLFVHKLPVQSYRARFVLTFARS